MRTRLLQTLVWVVLSFGCPCLVHAHMDRIIELKDTALVGLPKEYGPAELDLKTFRLRIAKREMIFSPYLTNLFAQPYDLKITASWYHDASILPPYINLCIQPKQKDYSYGLLLNLRTLELIELAVTLKRSDSSTWRLPVALNKRWKKEIQDSIRKIK